MTLTVETIDGMDRAALVAAWRQVFATPVPKRLSRSFLRRFLAFEAQRQIMGGLPKGYEARLAGVTLVKRTAKTPALKPGGRLLREWNGATHAVDVLEDGFSWNGHRYRSLSAVARAITGARWSGPRFFGLRGAAKR